MMRLSAKRVRKELKTLEGWKLKGKGICRTFSFKDFVESIYFVTRVAALAEEFDHHPDFLIMYDKVRLTLTTHDEGGLTEKDFKLARHINRLRT